MKSDHSADCTNAAAPHNRIDGVLACPVVPSFADLLASTKAPEWIQDPLPFEDDDRHWGTSDNPLTRAEMDAQPRGGTAQSEKGRNPRIVVGIDPGAEPVLTAFMVTLDVNLQPTIYLKSEDWNNKGITIVRDATTFDVDVVNLYLQKFRSQ